MSPSRGSHQAARVASALPLSNPLRRSLRRFAFSPSNDEDLKSDRSDSELSSPPSSPDTFRANENGLLGKRKRGKAGGTATSIMSTAIDPQDARRSPRKTPKADNSTSKRKPKRQPAKHIKGEDGDVKVQAPANWEEVYNITAEMRKRVVAPVDTMGCESLAEENVGPVAKRLQTLVALMLSSQTKDTVTAAAMLNLQENLPGGLCLESLLKVEPAELNRLIEKVGFHNNKTKYIKAAAVILQDQYSGDIPDTIEGLVSLPGVGPKMAYLCMSSAWGRDEGIGVDVHVHRITNLWGWHKTNTPEQTRAELESWLPKEKWHDINHLLVGFGQTICTPVGRKCGECVLSERKLCPSAVASSPKKKKAKQEVEVKLDTAEPIKVEEAVVEADDAAVTMQIKSEDVGEVDMQARLPDIEGLGTGSMRKLAANADAHMDI